MQLDLNLQLHFCELFVFPQISTAVDLGMVLTK